MASVAFEHVDKTYPDGTHAVRGLDLEIADGELVVLVGPSGCGKTTTLRMLAGLEEVTAGHLRIDGQVVNRVEPRRRDVAMVFQDHSLYPHLTVHKNLGFGLKMRRTPAAEIRQRVAAAADLLGLAPLLDKRPGELSGGQQQRVALGRAMVRNPRVFLFDEPLSNLDAALRGQLRSEIAELHRRLGTTMIYVTHDQVEAMTLGGRLVVMHQGAVQQVDAPLALYRRPANRFVAGFIGSPPMNFLSGELVDGALRWAGGRIALNESRISGPAVLGVRAEDVAVAGDGPPLCATTITAIEQLGHESLAYFTVAGERWAMRLPAGHAAQPGEQVKPRLRRGSWHLFECAAPGRRINCSASDASQ